jgi:hypothetical protein
MDENSTNLVTLSSATHDSQDNIQRSKNIHNRKIFPDHVRKQIKRMWGADVAQR